MEIDFTAYLPEEKMQEIVEEELRNRLKELFIMRYRSVDDVLTDAAYSSVKRMIDERFKSDGGDLNEALAKRIESAIEQTERYNVFHDESTYSSKSYGQELLEKVVNEHKGMIAAKVEQIIDGMDADMFTYVMTDYIADAFKDWMTTYSAKTRVSL